MTRTRVNGQDRAWRNWKFFPPVQNGVQILKFRQGINLPGDTFKNLNSHNEKVTLKEDRKLRVGMKTYWSHDSRTESQKGAKTVALRASLQLNEWKTAYGHVFGHVTLANFFSAAFCHFETVQMVPEKCLKVSYLLLEKFYVQGSAIWAQFGGNKCCDFSKNKRRIFFTTAIVPNSREVNLQYLLHILFLQADYCSGNEWFPLELRVLQCVQ